MVNVLDTAPNITVFNEYFIADNALMDMIYFKLLK